jgi:hypothetical protein
MRLGLGLGLSVAQRNRTYSNFIPSGSDGLITADSLTFKVVGVPVPAGEWAIEGSTIMQSPTPPNAADYRIVGTTVEVI